MSQATLKEQIVPALIQAFIVWILRFFTIPWSIWTGTAQRLAEKRQAAKTEDNGSSTSEFPVFEWFRNAWDGAIFLSWFIGVVVAFFSMFGVMFSAGFFAGLATGVMVLIYTYFAVIPMSLLKEGLILMLSIALNVERLANKNTTAS